MITFYSDQEVNINIEEPPEILKEIQIVPPGGRSPVVSLPENHLENGKVAAI